MLTFAHQQQRRNVRWILSLSALMLLATILSLCAGEQWIAPGNWFSARGDLFVWQIRLPRTLAVLLVGAALALSGAVMQALFENPLAEPGLLGVSNGAGVGLIAAVLLGQGQLPGWALGLCAIAGALIITLILLRFARRHLSTSRLLLAGVALGIICSALMTWAIYFSTSFDLRQLMYWMMGGFGGVDWQQARLMVALLPVFTVDLLSVAADEYAGAGGDVCAPARAAFMVLAEPAGGGYRLDGGGQRGACWRHWFYRPGYPAYSATVWINRSSRIAAWLCAGGGYCITVSGCCGTSGAGVG